MMNTYECDTPLTAHPVAALFPMMAPDEFASLVADIRANDQREPITIIGSQIIDGRNRYRACQEIGILPMVREYDGPADDDSLTRFVVSLNLHRRHLDESQRALIAARIATMGRGRPPEINTSIDAFISQPQAADLLNVSRPSVQRAAAVLKAVEAGEIAPEAVAKIERGEATVSGVLKQHQLDTKRKAHEAQAQAEPNRPTIAHASYADWLPAQPMCDLLLTDPPYSTDVDDVAAFASEWLPMALGRVRTSGRAYVCIGAYPDELLAYLQAPRAHMTLSQVLVWTYRNTLGPSPRDDYKLNWQAILYFRGPDAAPLDCPDMLEQFSVQDISAPDGRHGTRYHAWQKPSELAERLVRHASKPDDTVIDCFAGTGTFLLAASRLGRVAMGCERSADMLAIARERGCNA